MHFKHFGLALPAESNPTNIITQYVTIFLQTPPNPPTHLSATTTEYIMHMFRQQRPSDMSLKCRPRPPPFPHLSHEYGNLTWCNVYTHTRAHARAHARPRLRKNAKTTLYSRKSCHLKIYQLPVNQNFQYFQKSKFSDIKYCIFKNGLRLHSIPSQQNKALYTYLQSLETLPTYIHIVFIYLELYRNHKVTKTPYAALRSHVVETRLEWHKQPIA